jgi:hypothetical protein
LHSHDLSSQCTPIEKYQALKISDLFSLALEYNALWHWASHTLEFLIIFHQESSCAIVQLQIQQGSAQEQVEEKDPLPPPAVPFVRLFAYADAYDWLLMTVGTMAAIVHGAALPVYLFFLGKIINLFALYQQDLNVDGQHHLSSGSYQNLADELSKALFLPQSFTHL